MCGTLNRDTLCETRNGDSLCAERPTETPYVRNVQRRLPMCGTLHRDSLCAERSTETPYANARNEESLMQKHGPEECLLETRTGSDPIIGKSSGVVVDLVVATTIVAVVISTSSSVCSVCLATSAAKVVFFRVCFVGGGRWNFWFPLKLTD